MVSVSEIYVRQLDCLQKNGILILLGAEGNAAKVVIVLSLPVSCGQGVRDICT